MCACKDVVQIVAERRKEGSTADMCVCMYICARICIDVGQLVTGRRNEGSTSNMCVCMCMHRCRSGFLREKKTTMLDNIHAYVDVPV